MASEGEAAPQVQIAPRPKTSLRSKFTRAKTDGVGELDWTGRPAGGLIADIARRGPFFRSDWTDAFRPQNLCLVISSIIFVFFVAITPALSFGDAMSTATDEQLGVVETMMSTALTGIIYSMLSAQPLCIQGSTGPELAYTLVFFELCSALDIEFLPARVWQGLWCALITVILAVTDCCALMHHFTRFVEDIFAALISFIFFIGPVKTFVKFFTADEVQEENDQIFLWTLICLCTFLMTMGLRYIKSTKFFNEPIRNFLANFSAPIAILVFSLVTNIWEGEVEIKFLNVPENFEPTWTNPKTGKVRSWFVNPMGIDEDFPIWAIFFTIVPAAGLALLGFLDQNLTTIIINRPSNGLSKPGGYHLDLFVCGAFVYPICALLGLPFPHNSTAPSLIHLISLTKFEEEDLPGGGKIKKASEVVEQRFTNFMIHVLIGCALLLFGPLLKLVPTAVTSGIFLVMAFTSLSGNQLWERANLWLIFDKTAYPQYYYVKKVEASKISKYTKIQGGCFIAILLVTELMGPVGEITGVQEIKMVSVIFPFLFASLVFVRKALNRLFTPFELAMLDARFEPVFADEDENARSSKGEEAQGQNAPSSAVPEDAEGA